MAIALDAVTLSPDMSMQTSGSWNHTCSAGVDRALFVMLAGYHGTASLGNVNITYNGVALTKVGGNQPNNNNNTLIWMLINPPIGTHQIQVTSIPANFDQVGGGSISYIGVDQTNPVPDAVVNGPTAQSVDVPNLVAGDIALSIFYDGDNDNPNPTVGTKRFSLRLNNYSRAIGADRDGTGTVTCAYTGVSDRTITAVRVQAATDGPLGGGLRAQASSVSGAVITTVVASGAIQARAPVVMGRVNSLRVSGTLQGQASHISGLMILGGAFAGNLIASAAQVSGVISPVIVFTGNIITQNSILIGMYEPEYIHISGAITGHRSTMEGSVQIIIERPNRQTEVRVQRKGYKTPFTFYVDET